MQSQQTWNYINQFNRGFQNGEYDNAIQSFNRRVEIGKRGDVYNSFFKVINWKINANSSWEEIQPLLLHLNNNDAIELINHAVKKKLSYEFENNCNCMQPNHISHFVQNSLRDNSLANIEACYKKLFSDALQIDVRENLLLCTIKMDLADHMIRGFTQMRISNAQNELGRATAEIEEIGLRYSVFKSDQNNASYFLIFRSMDHMQKISVVLQNIRQINQMGWQSLNSLNSLSRQSGLNPPTKWNAIRTEFIKFQSSLEGLTHFVDAGEEKYIQTLQMMFRHMITFIDSIWNAPSVEKIESFTKEMEASLAEQAKDFPNLFNQTNISYSQNDLDNLLSTLRFKKKGDLFAFTEKMKAFLLNNMAQTALMMIQSK